MCCKSPDKMSIYLRSRSLWPGCLKHGSGWGECLLCSLWPRLSCILCLALMCNLFHFNDICLKLSLTVIPAKHDKTLDHVMTRPLIWTARTAVELWICVHWVPTNTPDIPKLFHFSTTYTNKFRLRATDRPRGPNWFFFPLIIVSQPTNAL